MKSQERSELSISSSSLLESFSLFVLSLYLKKSQTMKVGKRYGGLYSDSHSSVSYFKPSCSNSYSPTKLPNIFCSMEGKTRLGNLSESFTRKNLLRKCWKKSTQTWEKPARKPKGKILNQSLLIKTTLGPRTKPSI
jgi:hypothetical protein